MPRWFSGRVSGHRSGDAVPPSEARRRGMGAASDEGHAVLRVEWGAAKSVGPASRPAEPVHDPVPPAGARGGPCGILRPDGRFCVQPPFYTAPGVGGRAVRPMPATPPPNLSPSIYPPPNLSPSIYPPPQFVALNLPPPPPSGVSKGNVAAEPMSGLGPNTLLPHDPRLIAIGATRRAYGGICPGPGRPPPPPHLFDRQPRGARSAPRWGWGGGGSSAVPEVPWERHCVLAPGFGSRQP